MHRRLAHGLALAFMFASLGAAQGPNNSEATPAPGSSVKKKPDIRKQAGKTKPYQVGTASWYGQNFQGKPTASGEPYEMYDMTAAHLRLPMGSYVRVTNLRNGKAVIVRVNDRGPIVPGRIIDLSYGAAQALQFQHKGLQRVRLDLVETPASNLVASKQSRSKPAYQTVAYNHPPIEEIP
jgi:rare lipoprotein A